MALGFEPLIARDMVGSFPSGHSAFYFALAFSLFYFNKKWGWWFTVLAFFMGLARIFTGVHYPSDILGGALLGLVSVLVVAGLLNIRKVLKPNPTKAEGESYVSSLGADSSAV